MEDATRLVMEALVWFLFMPANRHSRWTQERPCTRPRVCVPSVLEMGRETCHESAMLAATGGGKSS